MANKTLFRSVIGKMIPAANGRNSHAAPAYEFEPRHKLAQYAATGCLSQTFYATAEDQLAEVLKLCERVEPAFIARVAVFARQRGYMKDLPALLCAVLANKDGRLLETIFDRVINDGRMVRNFVQIIRSGVTGRKSLGSLPKRLVLRWLAARTDNDLFRASVGNAPSLADIVKMVHPRPAEKSREALFAYLIGRDHDADSLPPLVREYEAFKRGDSQKTPDVPFQMLTSLPLKTHHWANIARNAPWQMTRMNLNTFARHGLFADKKLTREIAARLSNAESIAKAKVFPYQLMTAYTMCDDAVPSVVREALQDAMEIAIANVPRIDGQVFVLPDVSGSMQSPVTGHRVGATTAVRCVDVAALVAAAVLRNNPSAEVLPFEQDVVRGLKLNPRDSVLTNAKKLASVGGGGTNCSAPLELLNQRKAKGDLVIFVSDNESWIDAGRGRGTATMQEWQKFRARNPAARLVCIDLQPNATTQAAEREDIFNVGGFSDHVFDLVAEFAAGRLNRDHWVGVIEEVQI